MNNNLVPRIYLVSACTAEYVPLSLITFPNKMEYALRHGLNCYHVKHPSPMNCWERPKVWLKALQDMEEGDWLWWMGCDTLITNFNINIRDFIKEREGGYEPDFVIAADANGIQSDVFLMRNCKATIEMLEELISYEHYTDDCANEQEALNVILSNAENWKDFVRSSPDMRTGGLPATEEQIEVWDSLLNATDVNVDICSGKRLNAYPQEFYGGTANDEEYGWHKGDFIMHLPGYSLTQRLLIFPNFLASVVK